MTKTMQSASRIPAACGTAADGAAFNRTKYKSMGRSVCLPGVPLHQRSTGARPPSCAPQQLQDAARPANPAAHHPHATARAATAPRLSRRAHPAQAVAPLSHSVPQGGLCPGVRLTPAPGRFLVGVHGAHLVSVGAYESIRAFRSLS